MSGHTVYMSCDMSWHHTVFDMFWVAEHVAYAPLDCIDDLRNKKFQKYKMDFDFMDSSSKIFSNDPKRVTKFHSVDRTWKSAYECQIQFSIKFSEISSDLIQKSDFKIKRQNRKKRMQIIFLVVYVIDFITTVNAPQ